MSRATYLIIAAAYSLLVIACAQTTTSRARGARWIAPADASAKTNPLAARPALSDGGRKLFAERCATCHGDAGRGSDRAPDLTGSWAQRQTDGALYWKISGGNTRAGMPAFSFLPPLQRWQLVMYVRELGR